MENLIIDGFGLPVIIALAELIKRTTPVKHELLPVINILIGITGSLVFLQNGNIAEQILNGIVLGLTAAGLYDVTKALRHD